MGAKKIEYRVERIIIMLSAYSVKASTKYSG
jgi:hypothetical protein